MGPTILNSEGKIKSLVRSLLSNRELFSAVLMTLVGVISFGLGRLSVEPSASASEATPHSVVTSSTQVANSLETVHASSTEKTEKKYVGSKNSNKYHLPWCSGAARIAEQNKVWFASKEAAATAGYTPASNCKGI